MSEAPIVFEYTDYREFLVEWMAAERLRVPGFSNLRFARRMGSEDRSLLNGVVRRSDRPLPVAKAEKMAKLALRLSDAGVAYFTDLARKEHPRTSPAERERALQRLEAARNLYEARRLKERELAYFSNWYMVAIRELALLEHFCDDPGWIASRLGQRVSVVEVESALATLVYLGFLEPVDGCLRPVDRLKVAEPEVPRLASLAYHVGMHRQAVDALAKLEHDVRVQDATQFLGVTTALPRSRLGEVKRRIYEFQLELLAHIDAMPEDSDVVYQFNLQLFPLSDDQG